MPQHIMKALLTQKLFTVGSLEVGRFYVYAFVKCSHHLLSKNTKITVIIDTTSKNLSGPRRTMCRDACYFTADLTHHTLLRVQNHPNSNQAYFGKCSYFYILIG